MDTIVLSEQDPKFKEEIASRPGAENFKLCFTCGTCTASCPVAEVNDDYDPRKIIRMSIFGMRDAVLSSEIIWMCQRCYVCYARCPQNVKFADVMGVIREMSVEQGYSPEDRIEQVEELDRYCQDLRCNFVRHIIEPTDKQRAKIEKMVDEKLKRAST